VYLAKATERIFLSPIKIALLPEVIDMYLPEEGVAHNLAIVKIDKTYPGQAYKVASALWGAGQMMFNKILIVVDGDVDIRDVKGLLKNVASRFDPKTDFFIGKGPLDVLDHSSSKPGVGGKLLIDATAKYPEELDLNKVISPALDADILVERLTDANIQVKDFNASLALQGISVVFLSVDKGEGVTVRTVVKQVVNLLSEHLPKVMVFVDKEIPLNNSYLFAWYASGNVDPERDCFAVENEYGSSSLIIDGTRKSFEVDLFKRDWPNIVISSSETIHKVNTKWNSLGIGQLIDSPSEQFSSFELGDNAIVKQIS
jgi:4-hydroxy-3-polyprenylbenzoate decarboxylase